MEVKKCIFCQKDKLLKQYNKSGITCRPCLRKRYRANRKINAREKYMWENTKTSAKVRGIEFSLLVEDIVIPNHCPVLGIPLEFGVGKFTHNSPSIDRLDNSKGYIKGNIQVVSYKANFVKNDMSILELKDLANWINKTF